MPGIEARNERLSRFIAGMKAALHEHEARGIELPIERRRLRTITTDCGHRASATFLEDLQERLKEAGVYTEPPLTDAGLRLDHWVRFSSGPFPPDSAFFPRERDLHASLRHVWARDHFGTSSLTALAVASRAVSSAYQTAGRSTFFARNAQGLARGRLWRSS